jgi:hypothetical protein
VGPRTCLDDVEKIKLLTLQGLKLRPLRRPARSQSLYRLRYPGSLFREEKVIFHITANNFTYSVQSVPGGKVNILGGHSIGHSKKIII